MDWSTVLIVVLGGGGGLALLKWIQDNAKAHTDVETLQREVAKLQVNEREGREREREMNDRLSRMEERIVLMAADNSHLVEKNHILTSQVDTVHQQNRMLIEQNGALIDMLSGADSDSEKSDEGQD